MLSAPLHAATFEEQRAAAAASLETQSEQAILDLLTAGIAENRPAPAVALASEWLRRNLPKNPTLLFAAARASELSGETKNAVAFHQQALKLADPKSPEAGESITAVHTLLIHRLNDPAGAYVFAQNEAEKLIVNPRFRQFDRWFLDQAKIRNDRSAFAARLLAIIKAGTSQDQLLALRDADLKWLLDSVRAARYDQIPDRFTADFTATVKALAATIKFDEEFRLLLDWSVSVKAYNMAKIDGKDATPPIAESKILLEKFPNYAALVQTDWAGGSNSRHYRDDPKKYWLHETEAKLSPIRTALTKLSPLAQADLLRTWGTGYYDSGPQIILPTDAPAFILANKEFVNRRTGPLLIFDLQKITPAQAAELAPHLALNPSPEASVIRALAAAGEAKDLDKAVAALLGPEAWRLNRAELDGRLADRLWHMTGKPGDTAKRDEVVAKSKALAATIPAEDAENQFTTLLNDYLSPQPKSPAVQARLSKLINESPDLIPAALADTRLETQILVREALLNDLGNPNGILKNKANQKRNLNLKPTDAHPLEPDLRKAVQTTLAQNKLESWLVSSWVKTLNANKTPESIALAETILKSPAFPSLSHEARHALRTSAPEKSLTPAQFAILQSADPTLASADLTALPAEADAPTAIAALTKAIEAAKKSPIFFELQGLDFLAAIPEEAFNNENLQLLLVDLIDNKFTFTPAAKFSERLFNTLAKRNNPAELLRTSGYLWKNVAVHHRTYPAMLTLAESSLEANPSVAYALALDGLGSIERHAGGHTWFNKETDIPRLKSIRGKAAAQLGLIVIPVAPTHPSYPIYQAQAEWMSGNEDSSWKLLDANWEAFTTAHRELSIPFLMWTLQRTIFGRDEDRQEFLVKSLIDWAGEASSPLTPTEKATIELSYGDIALQRGQVRQAHEIYTRTRENPAFAELPIRHEASLRRVRAERISKNYDAALQTLADLELERVPEIWTEVRFARAEVYFDREDFDDAKDDVDSILAREPNHPDSRILLGKIQLKRQKLMEATEVELGSSAGQTNLVPGERLKVTLTDPTLAVSGAGTEIEVVVWATSGDKETFFLRQFGDEKTKFRGEVATSLGAPNPGDNTLQVIGDDEVFYAYSERFREKMNNIDEKRGGPITIASDALLMASARKLLSEAEQRSADMELIMAEIGEGPNSEAAAKARIAAGEANLDHERHIATIAKPGNPIHVRVSDPDRSRTAEIDDLTISASASSGDSVSRITLKETATHSGIFEGTIPTTGAQASAFAQNSEPGRNPNMVISPNTDYPAWQPVTIKGTTPDFTVDLNDNLPLGELNITAREPGAALKKFIVQTAMNPTDWTTVGTFPTTKSALTDPWKPSVTVVYEDADNARNYKRSVYDLDLIRSHLASGWLAHRPDMAIAQNVTGVTTALPASIVTDVPWKNAYNQPNPVVITRFQAYFHENENVTRRFALDLGKIPDLKIPVHPSHQVPAQFLIAVNGKVITTKDARQIDGQINLSPGIHKLEIFATGWLSQIGFGRELKLRANLIDPENLTDCPDTYFDPATFPPATLDHRNAPADITANAANSEFTVKFADDSRARLIRLVLIESEGTAPALNKLALTKPDGAIILPVPADFADLNKNDTLEILTGDKISVRYVDDRFITKARERHERFLDVSFTDARAEFADMEPRFSPRHNEDRPYYEKLLRFLHNKPLNLAIHDADMDSTVSPDKVKVSLETPTGTKEFEATETGDSTGIFKLTVTPVSVTPKNETEIQVPEGGTITARYMDLENNRPGVPTPRIATISHAAYTEPQIRLSHATVTPIEGEGTAATLHHGFERLSNDRPDATSEVIRASWTADHALLPTSKAPEGGFQAVVGQRMVLEILAPQMALGVSSKIEVFAQTDQGRSAAENKPEGFDRNVPGTLLLEAYLDAFRPGSDPWRGVPTLPIYQSNPAPGFGENPNLDRFFVTVPLILGNLPEIGALTWQERYELAKTMRESLDESQSIDLNPNGLVVRPGENIHIGFRYTAPDGSEKWATASAKVISHPSFDLMATDHRATMTAAYVGENLNLRVVDPGADLTDGTDTVKVLVQAKSGAKHTLELHESGTHTGIFKASYQLAYAGATEPTPDGTEPAPYDVRANGFPVTYGDTVAARYTDANGVKTATRMVTISKGADGIIQPFSKTYDDPEIAMRTQFSLAEAYLEVAKRRRKLGENELADLDYITAKQLLASAMDQFNDPSTRAHAEYLLGSLTMEEAEVAGDAETKETRYRAALSRFINITGSYSETVHAAKAQYQIATIYERLKEPDIAAQEYVKLAYKYPDSEHLAVSMARLGTHFLKKAAEYEAKAKPLLEQAETNKDAAFEGEAMQKMAVAEYLKTASIFGRLQQRFPTDPLAGQAGLRAGQSFMRASKHQEAIDAFKRVIAEPSYDGVTIRAQAMYWSGMSFQALRQPMAAYSNFKRLTYDFPESEWAAFARGQLSQDSMLNLEENLELERLENEQ
jgi:outer membrane protein assembly factor BamD (BamD/ComL family)